MGVPDSFYDRFAKKEGVKGKIAPLAVLINLLLFIYPFYVIRICDQA